MSDSKSSTDGKGGGVIPESAKPERLGMSQGSGATSPPAPKSVEDPPAGAVVDLADDYVFRLDFRVSKLEDEVRTLQAIVRDWVRGPWK